MRMSKTMSRIVSLVNTYNSAMSGLCSDIPEEAEIREEIRGQLARFLASRRARSVKKFVRIPLTTPEGREGLMVIANFQRWDDRGREWATDWA